MKKFVYMLVALAACPAVLTAQTQREDTTLNRTVVVEQEYAPDIMDAAKVNVLPRVEQPEATRKKVEYDETFVPATRMPATRMPIYAGSETQPLSLPGYVRAGYGNRGNLDVRAAYRFDLGQRDKLGLSFDMGGMNGSLDLGAADWDAHYYRTRANVDYRHAFRKVELGVAGHFGLTNLNFLPGASVGKQKLTSGDVHIGVESADKELPLQFSAETNLMFYGRQHNASVYGLLTDVRETLVRTKGEVSGRLSDTRSIGLEFRMDNAFYTDARTADYTFLNFVPYFRYDNSRWDVRLGIPVGIRTCYEHGLGKGDWGANFGSTWWLGLDADASFRFNDSFLLYAGAESGELQMNDFRELEELNPYANLYAGDLVRTYETVDATLGFKASPVSNFWFNVFGGYRILDGDVFVTPGHEGTGDLFFGQNDSRDAYVGAELTYSWRDMYDFSAQGTWHNWNTDTGGEQLLYLKPAVELRLQAGARPVKGLLLNAGYHFISREEVFPAKAANVSNLYVGGSYEPFSHVSIYARLNNLLNKQYEYYQGIPAQGFHFVGGVAFRF